MTDYSEFLDYSALQMYQAFLTFLTTNDPQLKDTSPSTFNSILSEAVAAQTYITVQLLKQKVADSSILTATGNALSAIAVAYSITRYPGLKATGAIKFARNTPAPADYDIPKGTIVAMKADNGELIKFQTTLAATLLQGASDVTVAAEAILVGVSGNVPANTIDLMLDPVVGVAFTTNDLAFDGGTDGESDDSLRARCLYTIWVNGRATIPLMTDHLAEVQGVREAKVDTMGSGDVLIIVDSVGGISAPEPAIGTTIYDNLAAGCTASGVLGASLRSDGNTYQINNCSGGNVWVRALEYVANITEIDFTYLNWDDALESGTILIPAGTPAGYTYKADLQSLNSLATEIETATYDGVCAFDIYMGLGVYPNCWVCPVLDSCNVTMTINMTTTPESNLLANIAKSISERLDAFKIGEEIKLEDILTYAKIDYTSSLTSAPHMFKGIDSIESFEITCNGTTITEVEDTIVIRNDHRVEPGTITVTEAP